MSRETDAMQFVLDLLTDGIITSQVQQIGHTPHGKVMESELPFVQVYSPITENQDEVQRQPAGTMQFQLEIIDVRSRSDALRSAIAELDITLRNDMTFKGILQKGFVTLRTVAERKGDERAIVGAIVTVRFSEGLIDPEGTHLIDFSDSTNFGQGVNDSLEDSRYVAGAIGMRRSSAGSSTFRLTASTAFSTPGMPFDVSGVSMLRLLMYINPLYGDNVASFVFVLGSDSNLVNSATYQPTPFIMGNGWREFVIDIDNPLSTTGTGLDKSNVARFDSEGNMFFRQSFSSSDYGVVFADFGYTQRDTGANNGRGYDPGF